MAGLRLLTSRVLGLLSVSVFLILVVDVLWGVFTRYVLGTQAPWSEELARLLLVWLSMLGTALAYGARSHLGVDTLLHIVTPEARRLAEIASHTLILAFVTGVMVWGGSVLVLERWDAGQVMATMPIRKAWVYLAIPVSGVVMTVFAALSLIDSLRSTEPDPGEIKVEGV